MFSGDLLFLEHSRADGDKADLAINHGDRILEASKMI